MPARIPLATYRIQFHRNFRFADARELVPYLHDLGITDLYASPRFKARKGSSHGYDVADPLRVSSELGTEEEFEELVRRLKDYGMGLLLDIVPNHMAASHENPWWTDVLENGPSSAYAHYFDIDWHPATTKAAFLQENKVLLPVLGDLYGNVLENQELIVKLDEKGFHVRYYEHRFPLDPASYRSILVAANHELRSIAPAAGALPELDVLLKAVEGLPSYTTGLAKERDIRRREVPAIRERVWRLYQDEPEFRRALDEVLRRLNGSRDDPASFDALDCLLSVQPYRLAHWKIGLEEINYRRFFDINDLVGLCVENQDVFENRHRGILQLVREGKVTGLRVDHIDGLWDPLGYLQLLQRAIGGEASPDFYIVVEKILGERESLPEEWPIAGTTGYDFLNSVNALFIEPAGLNELEAAYARFTGSSLPFSEVCYAGNKKVMEQLFAGDVQALSHHLGRLAAQNRRARDLPLYELVQLLIEVTACLPVYRTYVRDLEVAPRDSAFIEKTLEIARRRVPPGRVSQSALAFLHRVLLLDPPFYAPPGQKEEFLRFVMRWQQFSGPVMAKGLEDTANYVHMSLASLSEVGGDPLRESLPLDVDAFHLFNRSRQAHWPGTMNATATHDTKRGEDARARINVLSEMPDEWAACLNRWSRWNQPKKTQVMSHTVPAPHEEALLYQTLLGCWPLSESEVPGFRKRLKAYILKAAREAKVHTNWIEPSAAHESALEHFVDAILDESTKNRFLAHFRPFQCRIAFYGALNSISQVVLKACSPGVPDFYQGNELWDFSMVDPDNRRQPDFSRSVRLHDQLKADEAKGSAALLADLLEKWPDGRLKLYVTWKILGFRRAHTELFLRGDYVPVDVSGAHSENVCAFLRRHGDQRALVVVPRFPSQLVDPREWPLGSQVWGKTALVLPGGAPAEWLNILTGESVRSTQAGRKASLALGRILRSFPVAVFAPARA